MTLNIKFNFYQICKIIFILLLTNISSLYAHNLFNGGCKEHCGQKVKVISNKNKLKNIDDLINISNLYAHNFVNGGCKVHCSNKVKLKNNHNKLINVDDEINYEIKNSCLNKSLCRG